MRRILILFISLLFFAEANSQNLSGNSCTANLEINFLDVSNAERAFKNHGNVDKQVNLVLSDCRVKYNGRRLDDIDDINEVVFRSEKLPSTFDVFIGVKLDVPAECLAELLCELTEIGSQKVGSISVYFYKM